MKKTTMCCTTCPSGCALDVTIGDQNTVIQVEGNKCPRGELFAQKEWINPERMLTSTVYVQIDGKEQLLPVKSEKPMPKELMFAAMEEINHILVTAPVAMGQIIKENLAGSKIALVACKTIK